MKEWARIEEIENGFLISGSKTADKYYKNLDGAIEHTKKLFTEKS